MPRAVLRDPRVLPDHPDLTASPDLEDHPAWMHFRHPLPGSTNPARSANRPKMESQARQDPRDLTARKANPESPANLALADLPDSQESTDQTESLESRESLESGESQERLSKVPQLWARQDSPDRRDSQDRTERPESPEDPEARDPRDQPENRANRASPERPEATASQDPRASGVPTELATTVRRRERHQATRTIRANCGVVIARACE